VKVQVVHADNLDARIESQLVQTVPHHMDKSGTTFHMSLHNVSDEIVKPQSPVHDVQLILTLASDFMPDIQKIMAGLDILVDLVVRSHSQLALVRPSGIESHTVLEPVASTVVVHEQLTVHTQILDGQVVHLVDGNTDTTMIPEDNNMVTQRESLEQHNNVNIHHDMELCKRIREYDQRSV
jgi:copper homeostasis protein CutC